MPDSPTDNPLEDFRQAMGDLGDVKPIKAEQRVTLSSESASQSSTEARRRSATELQLQELNDLSGEFIEPVEPMDVLSFQRPGIQHGVFRNLRLGKYNVDARLDLHNHSIEEARRALFNFVRDCMNYDIRCALVTHGKGEGRKQQALLKSCVAHWLPQMKEIQAFHSAQKHHGGVGATYIMLRKSERRRQDNLERHQKRRT